MSEAPHTRGHARSWAAAQEGGMTMRSWFCCTIVAATLAATSPAFAAPPPVVLTKDGKLAQPLVVRDGQAAVERDRVVRRRPSDCGAGRGPVAEGRLTER